jgi:hypothetical protein
MVVRVVLLFVAVRNADRRWDARLVKYILEPLGERLVPSQQSGAGAVEGEWGRVRNTLGVLDIEVGLWMGVARVVSSIINSYDVEGCIGPEAAVFVHECPQVCRI